MSPVQFDRNKIHYASLKERKNLISIQDSFLGESECASMPIVEPLKEKLEIIASQMLKSLELHSSVMCSFGAHTIKNGLGPLLADYMKQGWLTHLSTNGAGIIHDWEFAYQGYSSEDVRENVKEGRFGTWEETGKYLNLALVIGAFEGRGYGSSIGSMITSQGLLIPHKEELTSIINSTAPSWKRATAIDLLETIEEHHIPQGWLSIPHKASSFSAQSVAFSHNIPFTGHPMFGHDIIYTHKMNKGSSIGRTAERDFLTFVEGVSHLEGGVYLSIGSAVMSPMIFEKALSMARNVALQEGRSIENCSIIVVDLMEETWNWKQGEPPKENPAYYQRFMKTFNRMGCDLTYICADNRMFLCGLYQALLKESHET